MRRLATLLTLILVAAACRASAAEHKLFAWRVAGDPGTVYLLGSIHVGKPDLYPLPQPIEQAFAVSPELVKEIDTSGSNLALLQQQVLQRGLYTGGDKLESHLSPPTRAALVQAWRTGDTAGMEATATRAVREHPEMQPLIEALVYQRNAAMARQVADFLKTPKTRFVVVGSLHLVGDRGILKLLADKGYRIEQLRVQ